MPIRNAYGDPNIAKAFDNLAGMFKPPTGSDAYGYAHAGAAKAEMERKREASARIQAGRGTVGDYVAAGVASPATQFGIADMFRRAEEGATPDSLDAGSYAVHGNANNTFAGQGRKLRSDERNKRLEEDTKVITAGMTPVQRDAVRYVPPAAVPVLGYEQPAAAPPAADPFVAGAPSVGSVSPSLAGMFAPAPEAPVAAAPARGMTQEGLVEVKPGTRIARPDGTTLEGSTRPQTLDQWKADEAAKLRGAGALGDKQTTAIIFGNTPIEQIQTPNGPRNAYRSDAVGQEPVIDEGKAAKPQVANYKMPDMQGKPGLSGTAILDPAGYWKDSQTGEKLPHGAITYSATLQGDKAGTGLGPTTANNTSGNARAAEVTRTLNTLDLYEGLIRNNPGVVGFPGLVRGTAQDAIATARDVAKTLGKDVSQVQQAAADLQSGLRGVAPELFDNAIPEAKFYQGTLAYALARTENPSGEVSRQAFERAFTRISGGMLSNPDSILATIGAFRKSLGTELTAIEALRDPKTGARTDTTYQGAAPGGVEKWTRGPDGQLVRAR